MKILRPKIELMDMNFAKKTIAFFMVFKTIIRVGIIKVQPVFNNKNIGKSHKFIVIPKLTFK